MNEKAQLALISYIADLKYPFMHTEQYMQHYYISKWVAEELLRKIRRATLEDKPAYCVLEQFIERMNYFSLIAKTEDAKMRFSTAYDTAMDIYDMIMAMR